MKIKITVNKSIDEFGQKWVHIEVEDADGYSNKIFYNKDEFVLRKVENGVFERNPSDSFYSFVDIKIEDEKEIDKLVEKITDLYKQLDESKKNWPGVKNYEIEI